MFEDGEELEEVLPENEWSPGEFARAYLRAMSIQQEAESA